MMTFTKELLEEVLSSVSQVWWKKPAGERLLIPTKSELKATKAPLDIVRYGCSCLDIVRYGCSCLVIGLFFLVVIFFCLRAKQKDFLDPLNSVRKYLGCEGVRLTLKKHEKKLEGEEKRAINFESVKSEKKKKRKERKRSRSRSRGKKRKRSRSRSREYSHKKRSKEKRKKKKRSRSSSSSNDSSDDDVEKKALAKKNLEKLRRERLEREKVERQKADR